MRAFALAFALCSLLPSTSSAQTILIYGPGGTGSMPHFPAGVTVTVASEAMWRAMTEDDFGGYDLLWVDGNNCVSTPSIYQALIDTQGTWGPAVIGRVDINFSDPDLHSSVPGAVRFIQNNVTWLSALGATEDGGATGMYLSTGCVYFMDLGPPYIGAYEPTFGAPLRNVFINGEPDMIIDATHPIMAGLTLPDLFWGNFCHGGLETTIPGGWIPIVGCPSRYGVIVRDRATTCGDSMVEAPEVCDDGNTVSCDGCSSDCRTIDDIGCNIDGTCFADGEANPENACEACDLGTSATTFTPIGAGGTCDDGVFCTDMDVCDAVGECAGVARVCDDMLACTADSCDEDADMCVFTLTTGCLVDGVCVADGELDPANDCQACDVTMATDAFVPLPAATPCDDGMFCTEMDSCNGTGTCSGTGRDCADTLTCTMDACDEETDACTNLPAAGCIVAGVCYAEGARDPMNGCQQCTQALSPTSFSFVPVDMDPHDFCDRACDGMGACQGESPDAGVPENYITRGSGCDCRATSGDGTGGGALLLLVLAGLVLRSRRRRR